MFNRIGIPSSILKFKFNEKKAEKLICKKCGEVIALKHKQFYKIASSLMVVSNISHVKCHECGAKNHV